MTEIINLRGHHLDTLRSYIIKHTCIKNYKDKETIEQFLANGYLRETAEMAVNVFKLILRGGVKINLINSIDDICQTCDRKDSNHCNGVWDGATFSLTGGYDGVVASNWGLKVGKVYFSRYILRKIFPKEFWPVLKRYIK